MNFNFSTVQHVNCSTVNIPNIAGIPPRGEEVRCQHKTERQQTQRDGGMGMRMAWDGHAHALDPDTSLPLQLNLGITTSWQG